MRFKQGVLLVIFSVSVSSMKIFKLKPSLNFTATITMNGTKFFLPIESVNKFPPIIEFFVQRIQAYYSNYVHEDLSRPPTYDKPVYTLSPEDEAFFNISGSSTQQYNSVDGRIKSTTQEYEYEDVVNTTEKFFEVIVDGHGNPNNEKQVVVHYANENDVPVKNAVDESVDKDEDALEDALEYIEYE